MLQAGAGHGWASRTRWPKRVIDVPGIHDSNQGEAKTNRSVNLSTRCRPAFGYFGSSSTWQPLSP